jgi:hypothetical protein
MIKNSYITVFAILIFLSSCSKLQKLRKAPKETNKIHQSGSLDFPPHYALPENLSNKLDEDLN